MASTLTPADLAAPDPFRSAPIAATGGRATIDHEPLLAPLAFRRKMQGLRPATLPSCTFHSVRPAAYKFTDMEAATAVSPRDRLTGEVLYDPERLSDGVVFVMIGLGHGRNGQEVLCEGEVADRAMLRRAGDVVTVFVGVDANGVIRASEISCIAPAR